MNSANLRIKIAGQELTPPPNWLDIGVLATFDNEAQANLTLEDFRFVLDSYTRLVDHISGGLGSGPGIFEPLDFKIETYSNLGTYLAFQGGINLAEGKRNDTEGWIDAPVSKDMSLNTLDERLQGLSYGLLVENGTITSADYTDVPYVVAKVDTSMEGIVMGITLFLLTKQLIDAIKETAESIADVAAHLAGGISGAVAATVYAAAVAIINIAYSAALLILIIDLGKDLLLAFLQPSRTHKAMTLKNLMEKACQYLGYSFNTTVQDLDNVVYLPSNNNLDEEDGIKGFLKFPGTITEGIPNASDYGYIAAEIFRLAKDTFYARYQLINGVVQFHAVNSPYWKRLSPWTFPDVLEGEYRYNTDELNDSVIISFTTDISDAYTIGNYRGTSYQVITSAITTGANGRDNITGLDETALPVALGNRKDELTGFEKFLKVVAGAVDLATGIFGGGTNFAGQVSGKIGMLKVATNNHAVPKLLWLEGGKLPANHRSLFSAKTLWEKYHIEKSFIADNFQKQRKVFEGVQIPFGFADFLTLIDNSYFVGPQGEGKITRLEWNMGKDTATIDYWVTHTYTKNLKETYVEPE